MGTEDLEGPGAQLAGAVHVSSLTLLAGASGGKPGLGNGGWDVGGSMFHCVVCLGAGGTPHGSHVPGAW